MASTEELQQRIKRLMREATPANDQTPQAITINGDGNIVGNNNAVTRQDAPFKSPVKPGEEKP